MTEAENWDPALARAYLADPFGEPSPPLRALLDRMRDEPPAGRLVLIQASPEPLWRVARLTGRRGDPPVDLDHPPAGSIEEAARLVFRLRWERIVGKPCPG